MHATVMSSSVLDEGLALFAGLNVVPKRSLTEYSCRIEPTLLYLDADAIVVRCGKRPTCRGNSFDLDFHTIPFHGRRRIDRENITSSGVGGRILKSFWLKMPPKRGSSCYANAERARTRL